MKYNQDDQDILTKFYESLRRHSDFYLGLNGKDWLLSWQLLSVEAQALMQLSPQNEAHYQQVLRAISHIQSSF